MLKRVGAAVIGWVVFGSLVEARRDRNHQDDPMVVSVVEADLASRHCPGLANDVDQVRRVVAVQQMNHASFFTQKQSPAFKAHLADLRRQLRETPGPACEQLWTLYGTSGWKTQLLKRV